MHHQENTFCEFTPSSWKEARELALNLCYWVFRGQSESKWKLTTTLERAALYSACEQRKIPHVERHILKQFQRRAGQYINRLPDKDALFEWLSLIQHYGGPTRLLDLTHSFYVACYFALERATSEAAIFCLNTPLLQSSAIERENGRTPEISFEINTHEYCDKAIEDGVRSPLVIISEPFSMNERLSAQQGLFAIPFEVQQSFEYNLSLTLHPFLKSLPETKILYDIDLSELNGNCALFKIKLSRDLHFEIKRDLAKMNINAATLFPGLDGFSRSLFDAFQPNRVKCTQSGKEDNMT
jgi:hypothetical protein